MLLVGDIGGTNARFALARTTAKDEIVISDFEKYEADLFDSFYDAANHYLDHIGHRPQVVVLAVAGPIDGGEVQFTNRKWHLHDSEIAARCGIAKVHLINDFSAMAQSVPKMGSDSFVEIKTGTAVPGAPVLVAGPGTGFGSCFLLPRGERWQAMPGEGGHSSFAPQTELEQRIYPLLRETYPSVSIENICGGGNLDVLVRAMCRLHGVPPKPINPQDIIERAQQNDPLCLDLCEIRAQAVMAGLANMALIGGSRGGVVIAGGVAKHLVDFLLAPAAVERFDSTWPASSFLRDMPIRLMTSPVAPLIGAAAHYLNSSDGHP